MRECYHCHKSEIEKPVDRTCHCLEDACGACAGLCFLESRTEWEVCTNCEDGFVGHDCGEDCCPCLDPEPNVVCQVCDGECGWYVEETPQAKGNRINEASTV